MSKKWFAIAAIVLFLATFSSTNAFLNVKDFDSASKTVTIKDWLGLSGYVKVQMTYNTEQCLSDECRTEFDITPAQDLQPKDILDKLKFYDRGGYNDIQNKVKYQILVEEPKTITIKEDVFGICETENHSTYDCKTGTKDVEHTEIGYANFYNYDLFKAKTTYHIILKGSKPVNSAIDWVFDIGGIETRDWAWWSSNWTYAKNLDITNTETFNHTKEVAIIRFNSTDIISHSKADFTDIRILNTSNSVVPYQLIRYGTNVTADAVTFPIGIINGSSTQTYVMYYGNAAASDASTTLYDKYDFFENASYFYDQSSTVKFFNAQDTIAKLYKNTTVIKSPSGTMSRQSLQVDRGDGSVVNNVGGLTKPFTVSWWQNPSGTYSLEGGLGGVTNRYGMYIDATGNIYAFTAGDGVWTDTGVDMTSLDNWVWFKIVVNATGEFYFRGNQSGVFKIAQDLNTPEDFVGFTLGHVSGGSAGNTTYDNVLFANSFSVWNEYYIPSKINLGAERTNTAPASVTLVSPADGYKTKSSALNFTCTGTANTGNYVRNMTFWLYKSDGSIYSNFTDVSALLLNNFTDLTTYSGLTEGNSSWNCLMCETQNTSYAPGNFSFIVDNVAPSISISAPVNKFYNTTVIQFLHNESDTAAGIESCWFNINGTNASIPCNTPINVAAYNGTSNILYLWTNDSLNNINSTRVIFDTVKLSLISFQPSVMENNNATFIAWFDYNTSSGLGTASFYYNNTNQTTIRTLNSTTGIYTTYKIVPTLNLARNYNISWLLDFGGTNNTFRTSNYVQLVSPINFTSCNSGIVTLNFTLFNELTLVQDVGILYADFMIGSGTSGVKYSNKSFQLSGQKTYLFCLGNESDILFTDADILYGSTGSDPYTYKHYYLRDMVLTNISQTINLYMLNTTKSTTFTLTVLTATREVYADAIVKIMKKYIGLGVFYLVEEGFTDSEGKTLAHLENQNAIYQFIIEKDGVTQFTTTEKSLNCFTSLEACAASIVMSGTSATEYSQYAVYNGIQYSLTNNNNTHVITYSWNDPTGATHRGRLQVIDIKRMGRNMTALNRSIESASGTIIFNYTGLNGTYLASAFIGQSPDGLVAQVWAYAVHAGGEWGLTGVFLGFFIVLAFFFIMIWSPRTAIIGCLAGMIVTLMFGLIVWSMELLVGLIVLILIMLWRMR